MSHHDRLRDALAAGDLPGAERHALAALRKALSLAPEIPQIHNNYGNVLRGRGAFREAIACYQAALDRRPDYVEARANMGVALQEAGDAAAAIACFEAVLEKVPNDGATWTHLGAALASEGRLVDAEAAHRKAIALLPESPDAYNNLGIVLKDQGRLVAAREVYQAALDRDPSDSGLHSNLLMCLCYDPAVTARETVELHRDWAARYAPTVEIAPFRMDEDGPLRVGYLSPDFREHSVAYFVESVFANHDPARVSLYAYSDATDSDETTARLRTSAVHWRDVYTDDTETLYRRIRDDGVQVLIDLAGHTANNRLPVFARRAAPVQVTWLGYGMTTGLPQMDYLLSDDWVDPPGPADDWCTEAICRLPPGFMCYAPSEDVPLPEPKTGRPLTFGSFNNLSKVNEDVVALWARVLQVVPGSELMLKSRQLADPMIGDWLRDQFARSGVAADRVRFAGRTASRADHYALYGEVDVALDTFPYSGATTTCEALWMGTPVVALTGDRHVGRFGLTFLTRAGFPEWVTETPDEYVSVAAALAQARPDPETVRRTVAGSMLVDGKAAARDLEDAYDAMWQRWKKDADG